MTATRTFSVNTVAKLLDRSRRWVYYRMEAGELKYEYIAGARRVTEEEFERFIAADGNKR